MSSSSSISGPCFFDARYLNRWKAERVNGNVQTPTATATATTATEPADVDAHDDDSHHHHLPPVSASFLQRRTSVAGNILIFKPHCHDASVAGESTHVQAFLLQRKLGNVLHGSIRLGYRLEKPPSPNNSSTSVDLQGENTDMETTSSSSLEGLMWQVVAAAKKDHDKKEGQEEEEAYEMVKIHIHNTNNAQHHHLLAAAALQDSNSSSNDEATAAAPLDQDGENQDGTNTSMNGLAALGMVAEHYQQHAIPSSEQHVLGTDLVAMQGGDDHHDQTAYQHRAYYSITPFYPDEVTLFDYLMAQSLSSSSSGRIPEAQARGLFRQMVQGLATLKTLGICHGRLSLTNVLIRHDPNGTSNSKHHVTLAGLGAGTLCIPPPPSPDHHPTANSTNDATASSSSLIQPSNSNSGIGCGTDPMYVAPEVFAAGVEHAFDGTAIDLWAASVMLLVMLVGMQQQQADDTTGSPAEEGSGHKRPRMNSISGGGGSSSRSLLFAAPVPADSRFTEICVKGNLSQLLLDNSKSGHADLSPTVVDLVQNLLRANPADRWTLDKVQAHPWLLQEQE